MHSKLRSYSSQRSGCLMPDVRAQLGLGMRVKMSRGRAARGGRELAGAVIVLVWAARLVPRPLFLPRSSPLSATYAAARPL